MVFREDSEIVYFMTKNKEFSNFVKLTYRYKNPKYFADQSELTVHYQDHLGFIKKLLSKVPDDEFSNLNSRLPQLNDTEHGFRTLKIQLEKDDFGYELQDDLFDIFVSQTQDIDTRSLFDNYEQKRTFVFNHLNHRYYPGPDFKFSLRLIKKSQSIKNEAKLILGLLNVLFWFDLAILDLHKTLIYLRDYLLVKINQILGLFLKRLEELNRLLYDLLELRDHNSIVVPQI